MSSSLIVYLNGEYLPQSEAKISVEDRGFLFSDGVYEVMKVYNGYAFTEKEHMDRLRRGLSELRMEAGDIVEQMPGIARELLARNNVLDGGDALVYIQITRGCAPRAHAFPKPTVPLTVYAFAKRFVNPSDETFATGVSCVSTEDLRWARCDIKSICLLPNVLANQMAKERGAYECVLLRKGLLVEASHSNVFVVIDGKLRTHPLDNVLPGITRGVIVRRAHELGIELEQAPIPWDAFETYTEMFVTATTTEIMPVVSVDGRTVGDGTVGPITRKLREAWLTWVENEKSERA